MGCRRRFLDRSGRPGSSLQLFAGLPELPAAAEVSRPPRACGRGRQRPGLAPEASTGPRRISPAMRRFRRAWTATSAAG